MGHDQIQSFRSRNEQTANGTEKTGSMKETFPIWRGMTVTIGLLLGCVLTPNPGSASWHQDAPAFAGEIASFALREDPKPAPDFQFEGPGGQSMTLAEFQGKVVLLNFWATWCLPCVREMPSLDQLQATLGGANFEIVALSVDRAGLEAVGPFFKKHGLEHLGVYVDSTRKALRVFRVRGLPTTLLIDRQGQVVAALDGPADWDSEAARAVIAYAIANAPRS